LSRLLAAAAALFLTASALAQDYAGTWTAKNPAGQVVTLTLRKDPNGEYEGRLDGGASSFKVEAEAKPDGLFGMVTGEGAMVFLMGELDGARLRVLLMEPGPTGDPNVQSARQINFSRKE
jgi:hypothetical protein